MALTLILSLSIQYKPYLIMNHPPCFLSSRLKEDVSWMQSSPQKCISDTSTNLRRLLRALSWIKVIRDVLNLCNCKRTTAAAKTKTPTSINMTSCFFVKPFFQAVSRLTATRHEENEMELKHKSGLLLPAVKSLKTSITHQEDDMHWKSTQTYTC